MTKASEWWEGQRDRGEQEYEPTLKRAKESPPGAYKPPLHPAELTLELVGMTGQMFSSLQVLKQ